MNVKRILATKGGNVITIAPHQSIREATALLARHNIGALVVVNDQKQPVGIISERDIIRRVAQQEDVFSLPVEAVMTKNLVTGMPQDDLKSVANTMTQKRFRHLPIVDRGKLVGIISIGDVVKAERDAFHGEVDTLQAQILGEDE